MKNYFLFLLTFVFISSHAQVGIYCHFCKTNESIYEDNNIKIWLSDFQLLAQNKTDHPIFIDRSLSYQYVNNKYLPFGTVLGSMEDTPKGNNKEVSAGYGDRILLVGPNKSIILCNYRKIELSEEGMRTTFKIISGAGHGKSAVRDYIFTKELNSIIEFNENNTKMIHFIYKTGNIYKTKHEKHIIATKCRFVDSGAVKKMKIGDKRSFTKETSPLRFSADIVYATEQDFSNKKKIAVTSYLEELVVDDYRHQIDKEDTYLYTVY